jgi:lipid-A-disaccharide synthase
LPFEKKFYDDKGVHAVFVGHPMADRLPKDPDAGAAREQLGIAGNPVIALLPGSRMSEVSRLGPVFAATAARLVARYPEARFVAPMMTQRIEDAFSAHCIEAGLDRVSLLKGDAETAIAAADVVLLASGTATLQTALLGRPMVVAYRLAALTYAIANGLGLVKVPHIALPNLLTERPMVPEFIQAAASPDALADAVGELVDDSNRRNAIAAEFEALRSTLGRNADKRAAEAVLALAES